MRGAAREIRWLFRFIVGIVATVSIFAGSWAADVNTKMTRMITVQERLVQDNDDHEKTIKQLAIITDRLVTAVEDMNE